MKSLPASLARDRVGVLSNCRIAATLGIALAGVLGVSLVSRYADWVLTGFFERVYLIGFLLTSAVLVATIAGLLLSAGLAFLESLRERVGSAVVYLLLAAVTVFWLQKMLRMVAVSVSSSVFANPIYVVALGLGVLLCAFLARGKRPWRGTDSAALIVTYALLGVAANEFVRILVIQRRYERVALPMYALQVEIWSDRHAMAVKSAVVSGIVRPTDILRDHSVWGHKLKVRSGVAEKLRTGQSVMLPVVIIHDDFCRRFDLSGQDVP